ncbi:MAG: hypothetical protein Q9M39_04995 [Sulfurovum sp.]|nr:hypothetical protein [Sulfurovum sp.]
MGIKNIFCGMKSFWVATGANACAHKYFAYAQKIQRTYNLWVERYEKAYAEAKKQQIVKIKGQ